MKQPLRIVVDAVSRGIDAIAGPFWPLEAISRRTGLPDTAWWERPAAALTVLAMLFGLAIAVNRAAEGGGTDFRRFYESGRYLLEHGARHPHPEAARYLPSADVPWMFLATMPMPAAVCLWYLLGCWSWFCLLDAIDRYLLAGCNEPERRRILLGVGLLVLPLALDGLCLANPHIFMVWLMVAGLGLVSRGRSAWGGLVLGLAIWVKLLPLAGAVYLMLKRKWVPALLAVGFAAALDVSLSVAAFGPRAAWDEHLKWWHNEGAGAARRQLNHSDSVDEDRLTNQSMPVILRRVLTSAGSTPGSVRDQLILAHLSRRQLKAVYLATMGLFGLAILLVCRRPGRLLSDRQWGTEIALMLLATMWFSPVVWGYHPTAVTPALAIVLSHEPRRPGTVRAMVCVWLLALVLMAFPLARACGVLMGASFLIAAVLVRLQRERPSPAAGNPDGPILAADPTRAGIGLLVSSRAGPED
jgi:hypothetical protein